MSRAKCRLSQARLVVRCKLQSPLLDQSTRLNIFLITQYTIIRIYFTEKSLSVSIASRVTRVRSQTDAQI